MHAIDSPAELSRLLSVRNARLVAIDGAHGSGKSTLAKTLAPTLNAKLVEADQFLTEHQNSYFPNLDCEALAKAVDPGKLCIIDGICMRQILAASSLRPDVYVYVKRMARWGWADEDDLVFEGPVQDHLEALKKSAAPFFESGNDSQLGLWEEVIRYHAVYRPHENCDFSMKFPPQYWHWVMRLCALLFALVVLGTFLAPAGSSPRFACYMGFPCLMVAYLWARGKARPDEEFHDTPWST